MANPLLVAEPSAAPRRRVTLPILLGIVGVTVFVATEAFAGAVASAWAIAGLMHLSETVFFSLAAILCLGAAALTAWAGKLAYVSETHPDNN